MNKYRQDLVKSISHWTGEKKYRINDLLNTLITRSKELKLASAEPEKIILLKISIYITALIMNYIYTGRFRGSK